MDALSWQNEIDIYINTLKKDKVYLKLKVCYEDILNKYHILISNFILAKDNLIKANKYYKDYDKLKEAYQIAKTKLYQKEEVQTYFKLQRELEEKINGDIANLYEQVIF